MLGSLRMSRQTIRLLEGLLSSASSWHYGYDLSRGTGLKSGTLYPLLMRLAERGWLEARWEPAEPGRPPRHMYRLTGPGVKAAREQMRAKPSWSTTKEAAGHGVSS
jgi:DNA-binding PadR family transcriptional regulator